MNYHAWLFLFSMLFSLPPYSTPAADEPTKADTRSPPGHRHDKSGKAHAVYGHAVSRAGQRGKASKVTRTIRMQALDTMRYSPDKLTVKSGQTVRFTLTNAGKIKHKFAIGDAEEQPQYSETMKEMPDMKHDEGNEWLAWMYQTPVVSLVQVGTADLATFRKHLLHEKAQRATTINRSLERLMHANRSGL